MAVMGKKVWAVVCGMVRQEFELYSVLTWLCEQRSKGLIEGIIISTWLGEIDKIPHLRSKLLFLNILAIELPPFDDNANLYYRQAYQLKEAMDVIPDDVFVLKCRTDFCIDLLNQMLPILENKADLSVRTFGNFKTCLRYRIAVGELGISGPFICQDICFLGYKQDIYKTVIFEDKNLRFSNPLAPDLLFFVNIFISDYPLIDDFFKSFKFWGLKKQLTSQFQAFNKDIELPGMLNKFYALYFVLIYTSFFLYNDIGFEKNEANIMDIFGRDLSVIVVGWGTYLKSSKVLDMIIEGNITDTPSNRKFYKEIMKLASPDYAVTNYFTFDDYSETVDFGRKYFGIEPGRWLMPYRKVKNINVDKNIGFNESLSILFSDYDVDENFMTVFHDIITGKEGEYYGRITGYLNDLSKYKNLYEIALFASSRGQDPYVLRCIAEMLYNKRINQKNIGMAKFIFLRQSRSPSFFSGKMSVDKIAALYYYGKYSEPLNDDTISKKFYNSLVNDFGLSAERKIPASYADAVLDVMKEIIETKREEIASNTTIGNMLTFLIEICGKDWMSNETEQYLLENFPK